MTKKLTNTNATAAAFGWDFQYNLALYIVMNQDLKLVERFKVEGQTEDIEIYYRNREPLFIQAKSQENPDSTNTTGEHLNNAINSLLNAVSKVRTNYSETIYGSNIEIPIRANVKPRLFEGPVVELRYNELPESHKKKLDKIIDKVIKDNNLAVEKDDFKEKFSVLKLTFHGVSNDTRYRFVEEKVIDKLNKIGIERYKSRKIFKLLQDEFQKNTSKRIDYSIRELGWTIILYSIEEDEKTVFEIFDISPFNESRLRTEFSELIYDKTLEFEFITSITTDFLVYSLSNSHQGRREISINFINEKWKDYKDSVILSKSIDEDLLEDLTKVVLFRILSSQSEITKVKEGLGL